MAEEKPIGKVTHFFSNIGVAIIELDGSLKVGDRIKMVVGDSEIEKDVDSMEVDHKKIQEAKKGDVVGIKIGEKIREGIAVYKI
jgi:putative protease